MEEEFVVDRESALEKAVLLNHWRSPENPAMNRIAKTASSGVLGLIGVNAVFHVVKAVFRREDDVATDSSPSNVLEVLLKRENAVMCRNVKRNRMRSTMSRHGPLGLHGLRVLASLQRKHEEDSARSPILLFRDSAQDPFFNRDHVFLRIVWQYLEAGPRGQNGPFVPRIVEETEDIRSGTECAANLFQPTGVPIVLATHSINVPVFRMKNVELQ